MSRRALCCVRVGIPEIAGAENQAREIIAECEALFRRDGTPPGLNAGVARDPSGAFVSIRNDEVLDIIALEWLVRQLAERFALAGVHVATWVWDDVDERGLHVYNSGGFALKVGASTQWTPNARAHLHNEADKAGTGLLRRWRVTIDHNETRSHTFEVVACRPEGAEMQARIACEHHDFGQDAVSYAANEVAAVVAMEVAAMKVES